jgi:NAD(P)H dehydrogenase (quinone)
MKKILVIKSHPRKDSYCDALAISYIRGVKEKGNFIKELSLRDLSLESFLKYGHKEAPILNKDLQNAQELILWADILVFFYPTWWAMPPSILKAFLESVLLPGFAYKYKRPLWFIPRWDKLLKGKEARIVATMDSYPIYYKLCAKDPGFKMMKDVLVFCGIRKVKKNYFGSVRLSSEKKRGDWLRKIYEVGKKE